MYSVGIAYLFWLFSGFGALGFHRFYLGKILTGLLWMCTGGLGMVGSVYDFLTLPGQVREANIRQAILDSYLGRNDNQSWRNSTNNQSRYNSDDNRSWRNVDDGEVHIVHEMDSD